MKINSVHFKKPQRRLEVAQETSYRKYKDALREDFHQSCGYCGGSDERADSSTFHIDHFAPKKKFSHLETNYLNLVYSCRFCNVSKKDFWVGTTPDISHDGKRGFVDPCCEEYDNHLVRDKFGRIIPNSELGEFLVRRLRLNLLRHEKLWQSRRALNLRHKVQRALDLIKNGLLQVGDKMHIELLEAYVELNGKIELYEEEARRGTRKG